VIFDLTARHTFYPLFTAGYRDVSPVVQPVAATLFVLGAVTALVVIATSGPGALGRPGRSDPLSPARWAA
jgi:hypothetical protein